MVDSTGFRGVVEFLGRIGVYDIILPFLLVFTIMFAILEKTRIFGEEEIAGKKWPKKNLNSIVALVTGFLVIASTKLVATINEVMANVVLLLILGICFLLLVGTFNTSEKEFFFKTDSPWFKFLTVLMFIGIVLIFINAIGWMEYIYTVFRNWDAEWASSLIFIAVILLFVIYITYEKGPTATGEKGGSK